MAFIDLRSQRERFETGGSTLNDPKNPSPQTLIQKPFDFKYNYVTSRSTDLERFTKFLATSSGAKFQANFALLQQSQQELNQKVAASATGTTRVGNILRKVGARALGTFLGNVGFTANIAKQIPVMGTGVHFINNTSGRFYIDSTAGSSKVVKDLLNTFLRNVGIQGSEKGGPLPVFDPAGVGRVDDLHKDLAGGSNFDSGVSGLADKSGDYQQRQVSQPEGEKGGFGDIQNAIVGNNELSGTGVGFAESPTELGRLSDAYENVSTNLVSKGLVNRDNNSRLSSKLSEQISPKGNAINIKTTLDSKFGAGKNNIPGLDYIESTTVDTTLEEETAISEAYGQQLIPFSFSSLTPDKSTTLFFNAFLDNYSDNFNGSWNGTQYIGRAEQFYTYQGFNRGINFSFKVAAFNQDQLKNLYRKLNMLAATTAPSYSESGNFMRGTLTRISIGDLIYRLNGFVEGVDLSWNTTYPWEIDVEQKGSVNKVPHLLDVSVKFTPIHNFNVKSDLDFEGGEGYFGAKLRTTKKTVSSIKPAGIVSTPPTLPTATAPSIPRPTVGSVEVGQGDFGGPFDNGDFVDIDTLPDDYFTDI